MRKTGDGYVGRDLDKRKKAGVKRRRGKGGKRPESRNLSSSWEAFAHARRCN